MNEPRHTTQTECVEVVLDHAPEALLVANLGISSWVLSSVDDRPRNFYMRGAMGGTTPTGMGVALTVSEDVVALDGDGSLLMSLGCLSTVGEYGPSNLVIVVMDNGRYETTGGQPASSPGVNFAAVADACGIESFRTDSVQEFELAFGEALNHDGPALIECFVEPADIGAPEGYDYGHTFQTNRFRSATEDA